MYGTHRALQSTVGIAYRYRPINQQANPVGFAFNDQGIADLELSVQLIGFQA